MKKKVLIGAVFGFAAGAAAAIAGKNAVDKVIKEIKGELDNESFVSPSGKNVVTIFCGSSESAKGLTYIKVRATSEAKPDSCELIAFARKKSRAIVGEWLDEEHFKLTIGNGKRKQCCDVNFEGEQIIARYYFIKG